MLDGGSNGGELLGGELRGGRISVGGCSHSGRALLGGAPVERMVDALGGGPDEVGNEGGCVGDRGVLGGKRAGGALFSAVGSPPPKRGRRGAGRGGFPPLDPPLLGALGYPPPPPL
jgi:hypothetical protein